MGGCQHTLREQAGASNNLALALACHNQNIKAAAVLLGLESVQASVRSLYLSERLGTPAKKCLMIMLRVHSLLNEALGFTEQERQTVLN